MNRFEPRTDEGEKLINVTPIIYHLEDQGMTESEVMQWFELNNPDHTHEVAIYYEGLRSGIKNPLILSLEKLKKLLPGFIS